MVSYMTPLSRVSTILSVPIVNSIEKFLQTLNRCFSQPERLVFLLMSFGKGSSDKKSNESSGLPPMRGGKQTAFLGTGSRVAGKIAFDGPAILGGHVEGEIKAETHLEIGESAVINAKIEGSEVIVKGTVQGDVVATSKLELFRPGKIIGNVSCGSLHIEDGAVFEGSCKMLKKGATPQISVAPKVVSSVDKA